MCCDSNDDDAGDSYGDCDDDINDGDSNDDDDNDCNNEGECCLYYEYILKSV